MVYVKLVVLWYRLITRNIVKSRISLTCAGNNTVCWATGQIGDVTYTTPTVGQVDGTDTCTCNDPVCWSNGRSGYARACLVNQLKAGQQSSLPDPR